MMQRFRHAILSSLLFAVFLPELIDVQVVMAGNCDELIVGNFSEATPGGELPSGWMPLTFDDIEQHTEYTLVQEGDQVVVKAVSDQSASGLVKEVMIDLKKYPVLEWQWKVENILQKGDVTQKSGDDYPARLYITFQYDGSKVGFFEKAKFETLKFLYGQYPPLAAINYIWASHAPPGTIVPNPFTDRVYMFVTQSGSGKLHQWVTERRNVFEDYQEAFGEDPPVISGIAIMTDTDNTQETAVAYFGDIVFKKAGKP